MSSASENTSAECDGMYDLIFLEQTLKEFKDQENYISVKMLKQMLAGLPDNMPVILSKTPGETGIPRWVVSIHVVFICQQDKAMCLM
jgi:hypothetical protein